MLTRGLFIITFHILLAATPAGLSAAPATADRAAQAAVFKELWRVEVSAPVPGKPQRARVLTQYGRPLSLADGLTDVGQQSRLDDRVRQKMKLESGLDAVAVQRGVVFTVAALLGGSGVLGVLAGAVVLVLTVVLPKAPSGLEWFTELPRMGPMLLLGGLVLVAAGVVAAGVGGALTAFYIARPPPPDSAALDTLGAEIFWDVAEAKEVVKLHNQRKLKEAGMTEPPTGVALVPVFEATPPAAPETAAPPAVEKPAEKKDEKADAPEKKPTRGKGKKGKSK